MRDTVVCRLCTGKCERHFSLRVLAKHDVNYLRCTKCGSLQTEPPHWLDEVYGANSLARADTGAVTRCCYNQAVIYTIFRCLGLGNKARILDFAGGNGLLCRMLRDVGFDAITSDAYAVNNFAQGFDDLGGEVAIVCAFEVAEHFINPPADLAPIFNRAAKAVIMSTEIYDGQGSDWWYLAPRSGQHVFFYSEAAMLEIARRFGFHYRRAGSRHLFTRSPLSRPQAAILSLLLRGQSQKVIRGLLAYQLSFDYAAGDSTLF